MLARSSRSTASRCGVLSGVGARKRTDEPREKDERRPVSAKALRSILGSQHESLLVS